MKKFSATLLLLANLVVPAFAAASFDEAVVLYDDRNYVEALPIAQDFAAKNDARAMIMLGSMFHKGLGVDADSTQAQYWYGKAADQGSADGQFALGMLLIDGTLGTQNIIDGVPLLEKAANAGNAQAQKNLGLVYVGAFNSPPDWKLAFEWLKKAADQNVADAQYNLALLYVEGHGVDQDLVAAANLFSKAALQDLPEAALEYGVMVFRGEGVQKNEKLGAKWLLIAANHGNPIAMNRTSKLYATGHGVDVDGIEAAKWNILAKAGGRSDAELDAAMEKMNPDDLKKAQERAAAFKPVPSKTKF
jgi:uncharacterized protein